MIIVQKTIPHLYFNGLSQEVIGDRHDGLHDFEFGLDLILDGLQRLRDRV